VKGFEECCREHSS